MRTIAVMIALPLLLAGCGGSGISVPSQFEGSWGADCSAPFVQFTPGNVHVFPDDATYPLTAAALAGSDLTIGYTSKAGAVTETYVAEGDTLRLDRGTYAGTEAAWHKAPMRKCG